MICEHCGTTYHGTNACPKCGAVGDKSPAWEGIDVFETERTVEAMIIGDPPADEDWEDPSVTTGVTGSEDGTSSPVLYYAAREPSEMIDADAVPVVNLTADGPVTAFDEVILGWIDGRMTVREIARGRKLPITQIAASLIALAERGLISMVEPERTEDVAPRPLSDAVDAGETNTFEEVTEDTAREVPKGRQPSLKSPPRPPPLPLERNTTPTARERSGPSPPAHPSQSVPPVQRKGLPAPSNAPPPPPQQLHPQEMLPPLLAADLLMEIPPPQPGSRFNAERPTLTAVERPRGPTIPPAPPPSAPSAPSAPAAPPAPSASKIVARPSRATQKPAEKLYDQALKDRDNGQVISAFTNIKLALVFDRSNPDYTALFQELSSKVSRMTQGESPAARAAALFERATRVERDNVDEAIVLLEEVLTLSKDPQYFNRLGVILAMRKHDVARGRDLITKAINLAPANQTYRHNLEKIDRMFSKKG